MTCKQCFGDQTIWSRDANGKAIEVPCSCVGVSSAAIDILVPTEAAPIPTGVTFTNVAPRPAFDELKAGDVVWMPMTNISAGPGVFEIHENGLPVSETRIMLNKREYDALPYAPMATYPKPVHTSQRTPTEADANASGQVLKWCKSDKIWYSCFWTNASYDGSWWMPFPNPPPPPEHP